DGVAFDTLPAATTGSRRAAAGVPLPAVMDAYRVASYCLWDAVVDIATEKRGVSRDMMVEATRRIWRFQNLYTDAMESAYRQQNMQQVLEDEAERAALTEALLDGRTITDYSVWEVAQLLRLPLSGPYVVIAAECPIVGKQALPGISAQLRAVDIFSAWRLLPDLQVGIAQIPSSTRRDSMLGLIERQAIKRVGVSPQFHELTNTAQALRYARVALNARSCKNGGVTVFDNSVLAVAAVSAPEITKKVATVILGQFDDLPSEEKDVLINTFRGLACQPGLRRQCRSPTPCSPEHRPAPTAPHRGAHRPFARCSCSTRRTVPGVRGPRKHARTIVSWGARRTSRGGASHCVAYLHNPRPR